MKHIIEVVTFSIKQGVTEEQLLNASSNFEIMLKREIQGFEKRTLTKHCENEMWIEMIWWHSMENAQKALETATKTFEFDKYNSLLEEEGSEIYYLEEK